MDRERTEEDLDLDLERDLDGDLDRDRDLDLELDDSVGDRADAAAAGLALRSGLLERDDREELLLELW